MADLQREHLIMVGARFQELFEGRVTFEAADTGRSFDRDLTRVLFKCEDQGVRRAGIIALEREFTAFMPPTLAAMCIHRQLLGTSCLDGSDTYAHVSGESIPTLQYPDPYDVTWCKFTREGWSYTPDPIVVPPRNVLEMSAFLGPLGEIIAFVGLLS
jgi:hypothetical protein